MLLNQSIINNMDQEEDDRRDYKQNLSAYVYQLKLLILMLWRGFNKMKVNEFKLGTELKEGEIKWDDALFFYKHNGVDSVRYLQAKHSTNENIKLKYNDFVGFNARIDLKKHFISFRKIIQKPWKEEIIDLILCTNIPLESLNLNFNNSNVLQFKDVTGAEKSEDIFYDNKTKKPWKKYQLEDFINGPKKCAKLEKEFKAATNLKLLVKEFVDCLFIKGVKLDLSSFWISSYLNTLFESEVLEMRNEKKNNVIRFTKNFVKDDAYLSDSAKEFRKTFFEACKPKVLNALKEVQLIMSSPSKPYDMLSNSGRNILANEIIGHIFNKHSQLNYLSGLPFLTKVGENVYKFSKDFTDIGKSSSFRDMFISMYTEEILKNKELKFKQFAFFKNHYEKVFQKVAEDLKSGYDTANEKNEKCIKLDFKTNELLEALNGSLLIIKDKHKISFNESFFNSNGTSLNPFANSFFGHLNALITDFTKIKDYDIAYYNYPPYFIELKEKGNIEDDIKKFLEHFHIIESPNETDLMDEVSADLGEKFNLLDSDLMTFDLFHKVLKWAKQKEDKLLSSKDVEEYITNWNAKLAKIFEIGCTLHYCQKLKEFSVEFKTSINKASKFLETSTIAGNNKQLLFLETDTLSLTTIKLFQALETVPCFKKMDSYIFNPLSALLRMKPYVSNAFTSKVNLLVIVDKTTIDSTVIKKFSQGINQILQNNTEKKVIVITHDPNRFNCMRENIHYEKNEVENNTFNDLTLKSQNDLFDSSKVIFQGKEAALKEVMNKKEDATELIDPKTLEDMITLKPIKIGEPIKTFTAFEKALYQSRKFHLYEVKKEIFEEKKFGNIHKFIIEGEDYICVQQLLTCDIHVFNPPVDRHLARVTFMTADQLVTNYNEIKEKNSNFFIHWLKLQNDKFIWFNTYIPPQNIVLLSTMFSGLPNKLKEYIKKTDHFVDEEYFFNQIKQNKILIITDSAGMGKSYVLTKLLEKVTNEKMWKIRINLNQYTATLNEIKKQFDKYNNDIFEEPLEKKRKLSLNVLNVNADESLPHLNFVDFDTQTKDFGKLVLKSLLNKNEPKMENLTFENRMFNYFFTKQKMLIVFDGFDEIVPTYEKEVMALFAKLKEDKLKSLWVTSRPNCKITLETTFDTFSYELVPFNEEDQRIYLTKYWLNNWKEKEGCEMPNQHLLEEYVNELIEDASVTMKDILGIPLQTKIFAEIFQSNETTKNNQKKISWPSCFDYVVSGGKEELDFTKNLNNIYLIYKKFIKKKIYNYFLQSKGIVDLEKPFATKIKRDVYRNEHEAHKIFGIISLCGKILCKKVITESQKKIKKHWSKNFNDRVENIGLIDKFNADDHPLFNHFTYGEYFGACYLIENLVNNPLSSNEVFGLADEIFKRDTSVFAQCFKYLLKENVKDKIFLNGDTILKYSARHGFVNCVNLFINSKSFNDNFPHPDDKNKTILYYAAQSKNPDVLIYLILYYYLFFQKEYEITFMYYISSLLCENDSMMKTGILRDVQMASEKLPQPNKDVRFLFMEHNYHWIVEEENQISNSVLFITTNYFEINHNLSKLLKHFSLENIKNTTNFLKHYEQDMVIFFRAIFESNKTDEEKVLICEFSVENADDKEQKNKILETFIECAVNYGSFELLKNVTGTLQKLSDKFLHRCFEISCSANIIENLEPLLPHLKRLPLDSKYFNILHAALDQNSSSKIIKHIIETSEIDVNAANENGETALFFAVKCNCNIKIIEYLISKGLKPNKLNNKKESPWTLAVGNADNEIVEYLLHSQKTILNGSENMMQSITEYFNNPEKFTENLKPYIKSAFEEKNISWCKFLLLNGGDDQITNFEEKMILYRFCGYERHNSQAIEIFENCFENCSPNIDDMFLFLMFPFCDNRMEALIINAMRDYKDKDGNTLLHLALKNENIKVIEHLLYHGFNYNVENNANETPMKLAKVVDEKKQKLVNSDKVIIRSEFSGASYLIEQMKNFCDIDGTDKSKQTLLHDAVRNDNIKVVKDLTKSGANINDKNMYGETPLSIAIKNDNLKMVKILIKHPIVFDTGLYDHLPKNESSAFLLNVKKCLYSAFNEDEESLKTYMEYLGNNEDFNVAVNTKMLCGMKKEISLIDYIIRNKELLIHFLQNGINIRFLIREKVITEKERNHFSKRKYFKDKFAGNKKVRYVLKDLQRIAQCIYSQKFVSKSIINFCDQSVMDSLISFAKTKEIANKIITNVTFQVEGSQLTLLQIAEKVNDEIIVEWLKEKEAKNANS